MGSAADTGCAEGDGVSGDFLLEIGAEEIPDWMIQTALADLASTICRTGLDGELGGDVAWVDATPSRLVLRAEGLIATTGRTAKTIV